MVWLLKVSFCFTTKKTKEHQHRSLSTHLFILWHQNHAPSRTCKAFFLIRDRIAFAGLLVVSAEAAIQSGVPFHFVCAF